MCRHISYHNVQCEDGQKVIHILLTITGYLPAASWHVFNSSTAALVACFEEAWSCRTATCFKEGATMDVAIATMCSASLRSSPAVMYKI